jgi:hypothetical protein
VAEKPQGFFLFKINIPVAGKYRFLLDLALKRRCGALTLTFDESHQGWYR